MRICKWAFNRTSMELKRCSQDHHKKGLQTFNRTSMELKPEFPAKYQYPSIPFNRTSMELKQVSKRIAETGGLLF